MESSCLPSIIERAVLRRWYMWHFSMQGLPVNNVTIKNCELLPHIFNLTPTLSTSGEGEGSYFLWHFLLHWLSPKHPALHRCIALCCPDFPLLNKLSSDSQACSDVKLNSKSVLEEYFRSAIPEIRMILVYERFYFFFKTKNIMYFIS